MLIGESPATTLEDYNLQKNSFTLSFGILPKIIGNKLYYIYNQICLPVINFLSTIYWCYTYNDQYNTSKLLKKKNIIPKAIHIYPIRITFHFNCDLDNVLVNRGVNRKAEWNCNVQLFAWRFWALHGPIIMNNFSLAHAQNYFISFSKVKEK